MGQQELRNKKLSLSLILSYGIMVVLFFCWEILCSAQAQPLYREDQILSETSTLPKLITYSSFVFDAIVNFDALWKNNTKCRLR